MEVIFIFLFLFEHVSSKKNKNKKTLYMHLAAISVHAKSLQLCPAFCDPLYYSLPGSSILGISQVRVQSGLPTSSMGSS